MASSGEGKYSDIAMRIARMPESGANPDDIARLIDANRDPELFWWICDRGTMTPRIPALQAMIEMLFHPDIDLHPHAVGETLDQIACHAPVSVVEAYLSRIEMLIADAPDRAAECWTDLTTTLGERILAAGRDDLAARIAPIDVSVERILRDKDRRAMHEAFRRFDAGAAGGWGGSDIEAAMKAFEEYGTWRDLLPDCLAELESRWSDPFWCAVLMRAISTHARNFQGMPDEIVGDWIADALGLEDERPIGDATRAGLAILASRFAPALGERLAAAAQDRRPFARGELHDALTDLLRHARPPNSTDSQAE